MDFRRRGDSSNCTTWFHGIVDLSRACPVERAVGGTIGLNISPVTLNVKGRNPPLVGKVVLSSTRKATVTVATTARTSAANSLRAITRLWPTEAD